MGRESARREKLWVNIGKGVGWVGYGGEREDSGVYFRKRAG